MIDKRENLGEEGMNSSEQSWKPRKKKKNLSLQKEGNVSKPMKKRKRCNENHLLFTPSFFYLLYGPEAKQLWSHVCMYVIEMENSSWPWYIWHPWIGSILYRFHFLRSGPVF